MRKGDLIKGYEVLKDFTTAGGGLSKWSFARKGGKEFFIKEFLSPKYPTKEAPGSAASKAKKKVICERFEAHHRALMQHINEKCGRGGNLVFTVDFFRNESKYYKVTEKVDVASLSIAEIAALPLIKRVLILKTIGHSLNVLHSAEVVHGDLKPDNVLIKQTKTGTYAAKLIDFDNSYFSGNPPEMSEDLVGDMVFYSPEMVRFIQKDETLTGASLTIKSDIFALGLLFCLYLTGKLPAFDQEKYSYAGVAVYAGQTLELHDELIPEALRLLIAQMLQADFRKRPGIEAVFQALKNLPLKESEEADETAPKPSLKGAATDKKAATPAAPETIKSETLRLKIKLAAEKESLSLSETSPDTDSESKLKGKGLRIGKKE
ncbi:MAG: protein kinase [Microscillaceae bacterium]|nr:protein kinase [Microscillaceae bacterium]